MTNENCSGQSVQGTKPESASGDTVRRKRGLVGFLAGTLHGCIKWGVRLAIALILLAPIFGIIAWYADKKDDERRRLFEIERARLSTPKTWPNQSFPGASDLRWTVITRCNASEYGSSAELQLSVTGSRAGELYSAMLSQDLAHRSSYGIPFEGEQIEVTFADRDGFEIARTGFRLSHFARIVDVEGVAIALRAQGAFTLSSWKKYDSFAWCSIVSKVPAIHPPDPVTGTNTNK